MRHPILPVIALLASLAPVPLSAAETVTRINVTLANFHFTPDEIHLRHGGRYVLHLANEASGGHDFVAKEFFAASPSFDRNHVRNGEVELRAHEQADVVLVAPAPGRYEFHCSHFMHATFGMKGVIVVD
jgi:uncharacterized cupredoxin-like copper-binding protein